jgi:hypothetical protein
MGRQMRRQLSLETRRELKEALRARYQEADREKKRAILDGSGANCFEGLLLGVRIPRKSGGQYSCPNLWSRFGSSH